MPDPVGAFRIEWMNVVEAHKSGVPHLNVAIHAPGWARFLAERLRKRLNRGLSGTRARYVASVDGKRDELDLAFLEALQASGFGPVSTAEQARNFDSIANYLVKTAERSDKNARRFHQSINFAKRAKARERARREEIAAAELDRTMNELIKESQLPVRAPKNFRRLRSGPGFLPPVNKGDRTGTVLRKTQREDDEGREVISALTPSKRDDLALMQAFLADFERAMSWEEQTRLFDDLKQLGETVQQRRRRAEYVTTHHFKVQDLMALGVYDAIEELVRKRASEATQAALAVAAAAREKRVPEWRRRRLRRELASIERLVREWCRAAESREQYLPEDRRREIELGRELEALFHARSANASMASEGGVG